MVKFLIFFFLAITLCWAVPNIVHPCKLHDYQCIGAILAANSNCNKNVKGYLPNTLSVDRVRFEAPSSNSSYVGTKLTVRNFNKCFVSKFFINLKSKNAVLSIDCPKFDLESYRELIYHQSLKEDTHYYYHIQAIYPLIRLTINLPASMHMNLCKASVFTDVTALPRTYITPKDQASANFLSRDLSQQHIFERESCYYKGFSMARIFINSYICDYGCYPYILY